MKQDTPIFHNKIKITLIENTIPEYRLPLYSLLSKSFNLQIIYSYGNVPDCNDFKLIYIPIRKIGKFFIHKKNLVKYVRDSDIVIGMFGLSWLSIMILPFLWLKQKIIFWGMGVSGSLENKYDYSDKHLKVFLALLRRIDAAIFYSDYPKRKYQNLGIPSERMFIAHNTVKIMKISVDDTKKNSIMFIGSLYKTKKVDELINQYFLAYQTTIDLPPLVIIGEGEEESSLKDLVKRKRLDHRIQFMGAIFDEAKLVELFSRALLCISPGQAGLSVQKSMGYGVPFVTTKEAFTGGEIFDIHDGENGVLLSDISMISQLLIDVVINKEKFLQMGHNAYDFYWNNRTLDDMIMGFTDAIEYVMPKEKILEREK